MCETFQNKRAGSSKNKLKKKKKKRKWKQKPILLKEALKTNQATAIYEAYLSPDSSKLF